MLRKVSRIDLDVCHQITDYNDPYGINYAAVKSHFIPGRDYRLHANPLLQ